MIVDRGRVAAALPSYELGGELGTGAFGLVLSGRHRHLDRQVAIKVMGVGPHASAGTFETEARVLSGLDHPHIVRIHDYVEAGDLCLIVMELLAGGTLARHRSDVPPAAACAVGLSVAAALSHAHGQGVLHRDIKPDNILLDAAGMVKVGDFGIAKLFEGSAITASSTAGTPMYMSPEQIDGGRLTPATDLYALGVVLYQLLAGAPPFDPRLPLRAMWHWHLTTPPGPPPGVPRPVADVVLRALAKDPKLRHADARTFALDLAQAARVYGADWLSRSGLPLRLDDDVRQAAGQMISHPQPPPFGTPLPGNQPYPGQQPYPGHQAYPGQPHPGPQPYPAPAPRPGPPHSEAPPYRGDAPSPPTARTVRPTPGHEAPPARLGPVPARTPKRPRRAHVLVASALALALAAVASLAVVLTRGDDPPADRLNAAANGGSQGGATPEPVASDTGSLSDVCPATVVVQTDWFPEVDHSVLFKLLGGGYELDQSAQRVTGPLMDDAVDTGVDIEIRFGGPSIGYQQVSAQMHADADITMGLVATDEAIQNSATRPTLAVLAPLEVSLEMIMWDPATLPEITTVAGLGGTGTTVLYYETSTYMQYLLGEGLLSSSQVDGSYDGSPSRWVAEGGRIAQQGYATAEPYIYEHEIAAWDKPVAFQLINDTGYRNYSFAVSILPDRKDELTPCLEKLVPIMQRAQVAYVDDPVATNGRIVDIVKADNSSVWTYSAGTADFAARQMVELGLVSNGQDSTLGNFDTARVQDLINILEPIFAAANVPLPTALAPDELVTNQFIDPAIGIR